MDKNQLIHLFYATRKANPGKTNLQIDVFEALKPFYSQLTFEEKVNLLLTFTLNARALKYGKKIERRRKHEFRELAAKVIFRLNFWDL